MLHNDDFEVIVFGTQLTEKYRATCDNCESVIETLGVKLQLYTEYGVVSVKPEDCPMCGEYESLKFERYYGD